MPISASIRPVLRTITISFLFENGVATAITLEWSGGMTVLDALKRASKKLHGITFSASGDESSSYVTEIDGQTNDACGNWMYRVNGELASVGCGGYALRPRDSVRWEFVPFDTSAR